MSDRVVVQLSKPLQHAGEELHEISLREPCATDYAKCGYPASIVGERTYPEAAAILSLISRCGGLPPSVVGKLCTEDFNACMAVLMNFFGEGATQ